MTGRKQHRSGVRRGGVAAIGAAVLLGLAWPVVASAAPALQAGCVRGEARVVTCTYSTPGTATFTVPDGVTSLSLTARGASGGAGGAAAISGSAGGAGGAGAVVSTAAAVTGGGQLQLVVGGVGADGRQGQESGTPDPGGTGGVGFGAGGDGGRNNKGGFSAGGTGGGGGGGSAVFPPGGGAVLLAAAGGAGGGGGQGGTTNNGGNGGDAGSDGAPGTVNDGTPTPGSPTPGGRAGAADGPTGQTAPGPAGGSAGSGGGGGGNPGGGASAATARFSAGAGGGGGTSTGGTVAGTTNTGNGSVTITYTEPLTAGAITATSGSGQSAQTGQAFPNPLVATVTDGSSANTPVPGAPVTFTVTSGSATFSGGTTTTVDTGAEGRATSPTLTAGSTPGPVTVTASTPGVANPATFTLTVTAPPAPTRTRVSGAVQFRAGNDTVNLSIDVTGTSAGGSGRCAVSGGGLTAACRSITGITRGTGSAANTATVTGTAQGSDGRTVPFRAVIVDGANPNGAGRDRVAVTVGNRTASGTVFNGNLVVGTA